MAATARLAPPAAARHRQRHRQRRRLVRPVRVRADRAGHHRAAGWVIAMQSLAALTLLALPAAWVLRGSAAAAAGSGRRAAAAPAARRETDARGDVARAVHAELPAARARASSSAAFTSPSSPPTCRASSPRCQLPPAVGAWALGDGRPVQHRRQPDHRLGHRLPGRPLAHEVAAVADLRGARAGRAGVPVRAEDRSHDADLRRVRSASPTSRPCRRPRAWSPSSSAPRTWRRCSAWSCCRTRSAASSAPSSAARRSSGPAATTGCGTPTSCSPSARR